MKSYKDYNLKEVKKILVKVAILTLILPFMASAAFKYLPLWISIPSSIIFLIMFFVFLPTFFVALARYVELKQQ